MNGNQILHKEVKSSYQIEQDFEDIGDDCDFFVRKRRWGHTWEENIWQLLR